MKRTLKSTAIELKSIHDHAEKLLHAVVRNIGLIYDLEIFEEDILPPYSEQKALAVDLDKFVDSWTRFLDRYPVSELNGYLGYDIQEYLSLYDSTMARITYRFNLYLKEVDCRRWLENLRDDEYFEVRKHRMGVKQLGKALPDYYAQYSMIQMFMADKNAFISKGKTEMDFFEDVMGKNVNLIWNDMHGNQGSKEIRRPTFS